MTRKKSTLGIGALCILSFGTLFLNATVARAEFVGSAVSFQFWTGSDLGSFDISVPLSSDQFDWELQSPVQVFSSSRPGNLLATINSLSVGLDGDPAVSLNFAVTAGAVPTLISVTSSIVAFAPISNADAFATAAVSLTDGNGNGGWISGALANGKSYEARFDGSSVYAGLIAGASVDPNSSSIASERAPGSGTNTIAGSISSIQSQFGFVLSANDSASGTSRFQVTIPGPIVPEPSSWVLLAIALAVGTCVGRRRLHR